MNDSRHGPTPEETTAALTDQRGPNPPPEMVATFNALAAKAREIEAQRAAAIRAEAFREVADLADNNDCDCGGCDSCALRNFAAELRRRADDTAPPSALRTAHAALAEQAGRDQAAIERVRRLCELTIADSVRAHAVQQALDTLDALQEPTP